MLLPDFMIIGAMKSGTTSLYRYLKNHPQVNMSSVKETNYFLHKKFYKKSMEWYASHFTDKRKLRGEASTGYTKFPVHTKVASRIFSVVPDVKLIYLVRDPFERLISHYYHEVLKEREIRPFVKVFTRIENTKYAHYSRYHFQLLQYLAFFPKNKILVITSDDFLQKKEETLASICSFLNIESFYQTELHDENFNFTERKKNEISISLENEHVRFILKDLDCLGLMSREEKYHYLKRGNMAAYELLRNDAQRFRILTKNPCEKWGV